MDYMIGQKFGRLTVISQEPSQNNRKRYLCNCECGNNKIISGKSLRTGNTKSCGCLQKEIVSKINSKDLTGQQFGRLTALKVLYSEKGQRMWLCKCECGNELVVRANSLLSGNTQSCGCLRSDRNKERSKDQVIDLVGEKFNFLTVIKQAEKKTHYGQYWICKCDCGNIIEVLGTSLRNNRVLSCGCRRQSFGEYQIEQILKEQNKMYKKEFSFDSLKGEKNLLRFDFAIFKQNGELDYLIECDGEHHRIGDEKRELYDKMKDDFCKNNNIRLKRIIYNHGDIITTI
jgi:hypothetical protein